MIMEKINVAELLKNCPKGMELDCTMFDNAKFIGVENYEKPICIRIGNEIYLHLTKFGTWNFDENAKCVIFPKGKTTWEGFVPPCQFKNGDIVVDDSGAVFLYRQIHTYYKEPYADFHCGLSSELRSFIIKTGEAQRCGKIDSIRFASEEEKQELFQKMKEAGYKWNPETKILEKLVEPKFKVGDRIVKKNGVSVPILITKVSDEFYYSNTEKSVGVMSISDQDEYELVPILPKFRVGDTITNGKTSITIGYIDNEYYYEISRNISNRLFIKFQDEWELVPNKFDVTTLKPFESRVLMRSSNAREWTGTIFSHYSNNKFYGCGMCCDQCIPYEGNEHLLGKTDDCDEFYKTWK